MLTGQIKADINKIWETCWSGGITNGLTVIEQVSYLVFAKRLDEIHTLREQKANMLGGEIEDPIFSEHQQHLRWSRFKDREAQVMFETFRDEVFPFIKELQGDRESAYSRYMKDAVFVIPRPSVLQRVVEIIDGIPMADLDTKGDFYEYLLSSLQHQGKNGQFRTPRHIIKMMVEMMEPQPKDVIADPACGTCGFLVAANEYLREHHKEMFRDAKQKEHFNNTMFHGSDFDSSMLRIGVMNMLLHGVENPNIESVDSLSKAGDSIREKYTLVLANPPFKGSLAAEEVAADLLKVTKTKKTELLFGALFLKQLKTGGRCACIVPDGVLFGGSTAHKQLRKELVENQKLEGVVSMPSGVFKPYAGVSTAVLIFTKTESGGTDFVWFYDMQADGFSLDDKRDSVEENDIPDVIERWKNRDPKKDTDRKSKAFFVPVQEIVDNKFDLSINRYKEIEYEEVKYDPPQVILDQLETLEAEIAGDLKELRGMLG